MNSHFEDIENLTQDLEELATVSERSEGWLNLEGIYYLA